MTDEVNTTVTEEQTADKSPSRSPVNGWAFGIILTLAIAVVAVAGIAMATYSKAADAVTVLAAVLGPLSGIGAAAFGVKLSSDSKAEAKAAAESEAATKAGVASAADDLARAALPNGIEVRGGRDAAPEAVTDLDQIQARLRELSQ